MQEPKNNMPKFTPEQLKQLMSLQNQMTAQRPKHKIMSQKMLARISKAIEVTLLRLDRFVNFVTKKTDDERNVVVQSARSPILFGVYVIIFCVVIGGLWASFAPLDSAAVAVGIVISDTNKKIIQHQEGGIIKKIFVTQGDKVSIDDPLIELEDTKVHSDYESVLGQYRSYLATEGRLIAERDHQEEIQFAEFLMHDIKVPEVAKMLHTQENLFRSKQEVYRAEKNSLLQRIAQLEKKIAGLEAQKISAVKTFEMLKDRTKAIKTLFAKGFAQKAAVLDFESKEAESQSKIATIDTEIAATHHAITESEISIINLQNKYTEKTLTELRETQTQVAHLKEKFVALSDALERIIIRSPVDGVVNAINYHTIGGVIGSGQPIMEISPLNDSLIIEARVPQRNIHAVHEGLLAKIRFSAFKSRTTPLFTGTVVKLSPDIVQDRNQQPGQENVYIARIAIDMDEFNKIAKAKGLELHPGMQAEVQIVTGTRTLLRYLLDPLTDTMFSAFKEK